MDKDLQKKILVGLKNSTPPIQKEFLDYFYDLARKYAHQTNTNSHDIDQNTQEILVKAFFDAERKAMQGVDEHFDLGIFVSQTMRNRKVDILRRNSANKNQFDFDVHERNFRTSPFSDRYHDLKALDTYLNNYADCECKKLLLLRTEGYKQQEIAEKLNMSLSSVKTKTLKCIEKARNWFKTYGEG